MIPVGTFINVIAVLAGSALGLVLRKNFPERIKSIVFQALGLLTLFIGVQMAFQVRDPLVLIFSVLSGAVVGQWFELESVMNRASNALKKRIGTKEKGFSEGLVTAFLLYCIGSMTIVGSLNEGMTGDRSLLMTKSVLDGVTSIALASTYGVGVAFSVIPLFLFQGSLTLFAGQFQSLFGEVLLAQLTATGGILILGTGLNLLEVARVKVLNMLPALLTTTILTVLFL